jgi:hypothetical protein
MSEMTREEMLRHLSSHGEDAGSNFNDSEEIHGRFGWSIEQDGQGGGVLSVTYEDQDEGAGPAVTLRWVLQPQGLLPEIPLAATQSPAVEPTEGAW